MWHSFMSILSKQDGIDNQGVDQDVVSSMGSQVVSLV